MASVALDAARSRPKLEFPALLATSMPMAVRFPLLISLLIASSATAQEAAGPRHISIVGSVYDSVANRPLVDALVQFVRTDELRLARSAATDSRGRYRIDSLVPGDYFVSFFHAAVDSLGVEAPVRRVTVGARDPERVDLGLPGADRIIAALCPGFPPADSSGVIVGDVRDADTGAPIPGATVAAEWIDFVIEEKRFHIEPHAARTTTGSSGSFALCGVPKGEVGTRAAWESRATGRLEVEIGSRSVVRRDFTLAEGTTFVTIAGDLTQGTIRMDTLLRGPARLTGTVLNETGRPVTDAIVEVGSTGFSTRTDEAGQFQLAGLPVGTHALEVRRIGFAPQRQPVQLASRSPTSVNVVLEKPVRVLDAVRVSARTLYSRRGREIEERRRRGFGHFILRDELERHPSARVTEVLRRVPGVSVYSTATGDAVTFTRGQPVSGPCRPTVFLDGLKLGSGEDLDALATVSSLEAIEVYTSATQAPVEYRSSGCGAIVLWTRVAPDYPKLPKPKKPEREQPKADTPPDR